MGKSDYANEEEKVLKYWQDNKIFKKSLDKPSPNGEYTFYDGPPFATGLPHYGHILAGTIKDAIPRYRTMRGYHVERNWGWDCHGLPIESLVQKENDLKTKKDIEEFGIKRFSQAAKNSVFRYDKEWKEIIPRTGRFVDMDNQYTTMDPGFMESVWWAFSELHKKGLVYEGFRSMHISPPLETSLSNFEVNQAYKDITDISVYVKFELEEKLGDVKTSMVAWTTTPWTLFGNSALAVGADIDYTRIQITTEDGKEDLIVAKSRLEDLIEQLKDVEYQEIETVKGESLVGKKYVPLFDFYSKKETLENKENGWKIYAGDFVTTEDGTGIVHIAPGFGEDDLKLGQDNNLPFFQHVNIDGTIKEEVEGFAGLQAKPKDDPTKTDIEVIKNLAHSGKLLAKKKITHSYPHCWRTDAPLLNYALSSWFIKVTDYNKKMVKLNKKIGWTPKNVGEKRFGNWLENVRDWGVSRSRYWGTPMPVWRSDDGMEVEVLGSISDIKERTKSTNTYQLMRHGESDHNITNTWSSDNTVPSHLTEKGKEDVKRVAEELKNVDLIYYSPLFRTEETADIVAETLGLSKDAVISDDRIRETQSGEFNGTGGNDYENFFDDDLSFFERTPEGGENFADIRRRMGEFIYDIDKKHEGKNILIISHEWPLWLLQAAAMGADNKKALDLVEGRFFFIKTGDVKELDFAPLPHDDDYILDMHRPYIDDVVYEKNGKTMHRIPDVFDTWFDSGAMPYAVPHYPFEEGMNPGGLFKKPKKFPADFIAEGLDQTRGWFYTLLALNTALFGKSPFKNVVVNGLVLAEDGRKMSKSLKNYPEPSLIFDKYGADAMRYYLLSSNLVEGEPLSFLEKDVDEVYKKIISRLLNVVSFYELQTTGKKTVGRPESNNIIDKWIIARLDEVVEQATNGMENYELNKASRPFFDFVDDLSTWYVRRSRDRFKVEGDDKENASATLLYVLDTFAKVLAPFTPFLAEIVYQRIHGIQMVGDNSVHMQEWPETNSVDPTVLKEMKTVRELVSLGLEARDKVNMKVRQPLQMLKVIVPTSDLDDYSLELIRDEVNVKQVIYDDTLDGERVWLDTGLTDELRDEGVVRELTRFIQSARKEKGLNVVDTISLKVDTSEEGKVLVEKFKEQISDAVKADKISFGDVESENVLKSGEYEFKISI